MSSDNMISNKNESDIMCLGMKDWGSISWIPYSKCTLTIDHVEIPWCMQIFLHVFMLIRNSNGGHRQFERLF